MEVYSGTFERGLAGYSCAVTEGTEGCSRPEQENCYYVAEKLEAVSRVLEKFLGG